MKIVCAPHHLIKPCLIAVVEVFLSRECAQVQFVLMIKMEQIDNPLMQYIATSNGFQKIRSSWMLPLTVKLYLLRFAWHTVTLSFLRALYLKRSMQRGRFEYWVRKKCAS